MLAVLGRDDSFVAVAKRISKCIETNVRPLGVVVVVVAVELAHRRTKLANKSWKRGGNRAPSRQTTGRPQPTTD